jgi:hypothetical protein
MYFIVSWDISAVEPQWSRIDELMRNCIKGFPQVRPVNTYYIVKVATDQEYEQINTLLRGVAESQTAAVYFIMTPLYRLPVTATNFRGWLPKDLWEKITAITS